MLAHFDRHSKEALGRFFRENRESKKVTQLELARTLKLSSSQHISNVERGTSNYTTEQIRKIVETLCLDLKEVEQVLIYEMMASFQRDWSRKEASLSISNNTLTMESINKINPIKNNHQGDV